MGGDGREGMRGDTAPGGRFGAVMQVHIQNDGPVTIQLETPNFHPPKEVQTKSCSLQLLQTIQSNLFSLLHPIPFPPLFHMHPAHPFPLSLQRKPQNPPKKKAMESSEDTASKAMEKMAVSDAAEGK